MNLFETDGPSELIDLTHRLKPEIPTWDGQSSFQLLEIGKEEDLFKDQEIQMLTGVGTHMDSPFLLEQNGPSISDFSLIHLSGHLYKLEVKNKISVIDIEIFEKKYGEIEKGGFVLFYTGWEKKWPQGEPYRHNFPTLDEAAVKLLIERGIFGIGMDTLSPDGFESDFVAHRLLLKAGKVIVENLANTALLPPVGAKIALFPLNIERAKEGPIRAIALVPSLLIQNPLRIEVEDSIVLEQVFPDHAQEVYDIIRDNQDYLSKFLPWAEYPQHVTSTRNFLFSKLSEMGRKECLLLGIKRKGRLVGLLELQKIDSQERSAGIGYWLEEASQGQGLVTKSIRSLVDYAFKELGLLRLFIYCSVENQKSAEVAKRSGFTYECHLKKHTWHSGKLYDSILYSIFKD